MLNSFYSDEHSELYLSDTFSALAQMNSECVDMIFADPPYFLSNDGISCSGGKRVSVNKGEWDKIDTLEDKHNFNRRWLKRDLWALKYVNNLLGLESWL